MKWKNGWTKERRERHRELIQTWKPWDKSPGPGDAKAYQSNYNGGAPPLMQKLTRLLRKQDAFLDPRGSTNER